MNARAVFSKFPRPSGSIQSGGQERGCGRRPSRSMSAGPVDLDSFLRFRYGEAAATGLSGTVALRLAIRPPVWIAPGWRAFNISKPESRNAKLFPDAHPG